MVDLSGLLKQLQDEAKAKQAEVVAALSRLDALKSAHKDTLDQVQKAQEEHGNARRAIVDARDGADKILKEADRRAGDVLTAAHGLRNSADKMVKDAENRAKEIVDEAEFRVRTVENEVKNKRAELQATILQLNGAQSEWKAIKDKARKLYDD